MNEKVLHHLANCVECSFIVCNASNPARCTVCGKTMSGVEYRYLEECDALDKITSHRLNDGVCDECFERIKSYKIDPVREMRAAMDKFKRRIRGA